MEDTRQALARALAKCGDKRNIKGCYAAVSAAALERIKPLWRQEHSGKTACYFSAEFLLGRVVTGNLFNLGLLEETQALLAEHGFDAAALEEVEDAALGNGGLGRLAACFLDSAATGGYRLDGYGIRYRYGLFRQTIENGFQVEQPDDWLRFGDPWSLRREDERELVCFKDQQVWAVPYDMPVVGFGGQTVNTLRLWQAEAVQAFDLEGYNSQDYATAYAAQNEAAAITAVLYPNDDTKAGKRLRLKQQYFFTSASLQSLLRRQKARHGEDWESLPRRLAVQLNDTHPAIAIPELLRLLVAGENLTFEIAFGIAQEVFAYTNHTIMGEALETWETGLFCEVAPEVYPYVVMLQNHLARWLAGQGIQDRADYDLISGGRVHMARMAVFASHSVNGVAALHTEILKQDVLKHWYALYPERFSNKTNGITQRRWLGLCNPELSAFITKRIGPGWMCDLSRLETLAPYAYEEESLREFWAIKQEKKRQLAAFVQKQEGGFALDTGAVFDVQVKRLHEYKRQLLNAFAILDIYFTLKEGGIEDWQPMVCLFGAKAAPSYRRAKGIIKFIGEVAKAVNADEEMRGRLAVLFVQNYNVSYAEKLIPAAEMSEQISTAGTEASGTGNMKLMLNGAVTLGTYDGANIEIVQESGEENNYIFGARVEELRALEQTYNPRVLYAQNPRIRRVMDCLVDGRFSDGGTGVFRELYDSILEGASWHRPDPYRLLLDFIPYVETKLQTNRDYADKDAFSRKCFLNTAHAGKFSSDRTIQQYATEIWGL